MHKSIDALGSCSLSVNQACHCSRAGFQTFDVATMWSHPQTYWNVYCYRKCSMYVCRFLDSKQKRNSYEPGCRGLWPEIQKMRCKVDGLEKKVEAALHYAARTNDILEALAKQQGIDVQAFGKSQSVDTDRTVDPNDSAAQKMSLQPTSRQAPPAAVDRRSGKQKPDTTRPSPIRRKAEADGLIIWFTNPQYCLALLLLPYH